MPVKVWVLFRGFVGVAGLVCASLLASLTMRFLLIGYTRLRGSTQSYWDYVNSSTIAFQNAVTPSLIVGCIVFLLYQRFLKPADDSPLWPWIRSGFTALTLFFVTMGLAGVIAGETYAFPGATWLPAWLFCLMGYASVMTSRRMGLRLADKLPQSKITQLIIDGFVVTVTLLLSYVIRFDGIPPAPYRWQLLATAPWIIFTYLVMNQLWGVNSFIWRFTSLREALVIAQSLTSTALLLLVLRIILFVSYELVRVPFGILLVHPALTFIGLLGVRGLRRVHYRDREKRKIQPIEPSSKVVILVGAGNAGTLLLSELERGSDFEVVGFLDDDPRKQKKIISGVRVLGSTRDLKSVAAEREVDEVVLSMPSAPGTILRRIVAECNSIGIPVSSVPSLSQILLGKVSVSRLRPVKMEGLLGRSSVQFPRDDQALVETYGDRKMLLTGAAGSIGSELARQLLEFQPNRLILLDKDENGLYELGLEICETQNANNREVIADIRDRNRLRTVFDRWKPEAVLHAAAYKHVPMMEDNPSEAILTNVFGTRNVVALAVEKGVQFFLLVSTDKAVNPTSVMGASKRIAEMIVRREASRTPNVRFCSVRFGNVLGSRASVIPIFQKRISEGKNLRVTHPQIKRFFMTIPEAVQLVLKAGSLAGQGETFVLDMGDPIKIADLARDLIEQSGLAPGEDIQIEYTGLRPGEKMFEELMTRGEDRIRSTKYSKIFVEAPIQRDHLTLDHALSELEEAVREEDSERIYRVFEDLDIGYQRKAASGATVSAETSE